MPGFTTKPDQEMTQKEEKKKKGDHAAYELVVIALHILAIVLVE